MTQLPALLEGKGIRRAVIIDDVYDSAPRPDEVDDGDWTNFFDDLRDVDHKRLAELYPAYDRTPVADLRVSQHFVRALWEGRTQLSPTAREHLFNDYESTQATERAALDALAAALEELGLTCTPIGGQDLNDDARTADLIFIDLFLGQEGDLAPAVRRVSDLVAHRADRPPLVVLMSRSPRLFERRDDFRDSAGLLGSTFRIISKADLGNDDRLTTLLTRLGTHYEDACRVAAFVHAWDRGLSAAKERLLRTLRRLDLSDLAQIRGLLLDFDGQPLGEYLLDVADRVLQHEIEADAGTIAAAQELNGISLATYPAPHLTGSPNLQALLHRMLFRYASRLQLALDGETPTLHYGDVLHRADDTGEFTDDVLLVATPACDLAREDMKHVLLLPGALSPLTADDWTYGSTVPKTPVFETCDRTRYWIKWHLKERLTVPRAEISAGLRTGANYRRLGRLRETCVAELQQRLLADMGRIGQPANPPGTFLVSVVLYSVSADARLVLIPLSVAGLDAAVCFVGRDAQRKRVDHLVLSEAACDAVTGILRTRVAESVHAAARTSLAALKADAGFFQRFERGIDVPHKNGQMATREG